jgi:hypothetical protein
MLATRKVRGKLSKLINDWQVFRDAVLRPNMSSVITAQDEQDFLKLKARIAAQLPMLDETAPRSLVQETREASQLMTSLLNRYEKLDVEELSSEEEKEKFEHWWHQSFVFLNKLKGADLAAPKQPTKKKTTPAPTGLSDKRARRRIPGAWFFRFAVRLGLVVLAIYILGRAFGFRWEQDSGRFVTNPPSSLGDFGGGIVGALRTVSDKFLSFFDPVVSSYGLEVTIFLAGVLLLALGYWIFVRKI